MTHHASVSTGRSAAADRHPADLARGVLLAATLAALVAAEPAAAGERALRVERHDDTWSLIEVSPAGAKTAARSLVALPLGAQAYAHRLTTAGDRWWLTAVEPQAGEARLVLLHGDLENAGVRALPAPATAGRVLLQPTLLLADAEPETLLWIEGETGRTTAVLAASWSGAGWQAPKSISPTGAGTQIALDAVRLDGGDAIAVWAAFDGTDDEILWSRRTAGRRPADAAAAWSEPAAITANGVPDVTPILAALPGGAAAVWSGYDGNDYRLQIATFDGRAWSEPQVHGGRGGVFPSREASAGGAPQILFRQTRPSAWKLLQLGAGGEVVRSASARPADAGQRAVRPTIVTTDEQGVVFRWPDTDDVRIPWDR